MRAKGTMGRYRYREREGMSERGEGRDVTSWYPSTTKEILIKLLH
jgi:hypothetical protein